MSRSCIHEKIDNKIVQFIKKAYGEQDSLEQQAVLAKAHEYGNTKDDIVKINKKINWTENAATIPTQVIANLAKLGARVFYPPLMVLDAQDILKTTVSALDELGVGELLQAADLIISDVYTASVFY